MRKNKIYINAIVGLVEELVAIITGFILPRMILTYFGSEYNGIISSVTQFIGCIALLKSGIGVATKAALYDPLYCGDNIKISGIMSATMKFLRKISGIFVGAIGIFACIYPFCVVDDFSWGYTASLVLIVSLSTFFQYFWGLGNQLLLEADQKYHIISIVTIINTILGTVISVVCMKVGMSIHGMKLCSAIVYCSTPILLYYYVGKHYKIDRKAQPDWDAIANRWDAFGMQVANFINSNTDIIMATLFLNIREVSVYTIYYLIINGIKKIIVRVSRGVESALGSLKAERNAERLKNNFLLFEFILNFICICLFSCLIILIVPFVMLYTEGVVDVNYSRPIFALVACFAELFYCLRLAYTFMVQATGAFAETKRYFYIEAGINLISSVILVNFIGLIGIVVGTLAAMVYRTIIFARFVYREIINVEICRFWKRIVTTLGCVILNSVIGILTVSNLKINDFIEWFGVAFATTGVVLVSTITIHLIVDHVILRNAINIFKRRK